MIYVGVAEIEKKRLNVEKNLSLGLVIVVSISFLMEIIELMSSLPRL